MFINQAFYIFGVFQNGNQVPGWLIILAVILVLFLLFWIISRVVSNTRRQNDEDVMRHHAQDRQDAADQVLSRMREGSAATSFNMQDKTPTTPDIASIPMTAPTSESLADPTTVEDVDAWDSQESFAEVVDQPVIEDDLEIIEGIGPKIAEMLRDEGIQTFDQLAITPPERLVTILRSAGLSLADPSSWPEQARLAAAGDMDRLRSYQEQLKGGKA